MFTPHAASFEYKTQIFMEKDNYFLLNKAAYFFYRLEMLRTPEQGVGLFCRRWVPYLPCNFVIDPTTQYF